ncbi:MAG TPA: SCO family protein [Polyangiaceae bacterium]|nr:SCO family protein [Polyangiaceae bacterium]
MRREAISRLASLALGVALCLGSAALSAAGAGAQVVVEDGVVTRKEAPPKRLEGIDIEEHLDRQLPLGLQFKDTRGETVALSKYVQGQRPVIFTLNYANCPMLCSLQLSGLVSALNRLDRQLGKDFDIVTVSVDPDETTARAAETEERYRGDLTRVEGREAWHFLTGTKASIDALADALGIRYAYNEKRKEYVHPASLVLSTPSGHVSRYLYGIEYHPRTLALSLVEAAQGKVGSSVDRLILYCFHYDATEGKYAPMAMNIMRIGGGLTAFCLASFLGAYWLRQIRRRGARAAGPLVASAEDAGS